MTMLNLRIKHASKLYDVSLPASSEGAILKQRLEELTEVPAAKQKILIKGKQLKDDDVLSSVGVKDKQTLFMLGTAPKNVVKQPISVETDEEMDAGLSDEEDYKQPVGIRNIGNTCYASATLQALHMVPELNKVLESYNGNDDLLKAWGRIVPRFGYDFKLPAEPVIPYNFIVTLRNQFTQFGERGEGGMFKQQDAEELYTQLVSKLQSDPDSKVSGVVDYFDGKFAVTKSGESSSGETTGSSVPTEESFSKLMCHINVKTNFLKDGLRAGLVDEIDTGDGNTLTIKKQITKLPKYLVVQFVRFFWRKDTKMNSKILRKVTFPLNLDIGDLCTADLQERMAPAREAYRELEGAIEEQKRAARRAKFQRLDDVPDASNPQDETTVAKRKAAAAAEEEETQRAKDHLEALKQQFRDKIDKNLSADETCSPHGLYDLQAIVSHQGMSADSGHYLCYTRSAKDPNQWWKLNDETVTPFDKARIDDLAGGGASDSALILIYKSSDI